jgi:hypothetical protein
MSVTQISDYANRDTIHALRSLLDQAMDGRLTGLLFCVKRSNSICSMGLTGTFKTDPARALEAAARLQHRLNLLADKTEVTPPELHTI